jgi:SAM-dependent methyltransferase
VGRVFYKTERDALAFGIVPAFRKYELYQARYHELAKTLVEIGRAKGRRLKVLDLGAGHGEQKIFADALGVDAEWLAVEPNPQRTEPLRKAGYSDVVTAIDLEQQRLPYEDGRFDAVVASHVLEHLTNAPEALADWHRVVAPGGAVLLGLPMHLSPIAALARLKYRLKGRRPRGHCWFFSMGSLNAFLAPYSVRRIWGFRIIAARSQLPLEDWEWFYRASVWLGARAPGLCSEVNVHLEKKV